jgi:hypothetical protein
VAKPRDRWRAPANRRTAAKAALLGAPVEERRSGPWQAARIDVRAVEAVLVPRSHPGFRRARGATGSVRGRSPTLNSADKVGSGGRHRSRWCSRSPVGRNASRGHVRDTTEAGDASSNACPAGAELPQGGSAPLGRTRHELSASAGSARSGKNPAVTRGASCEPGNRTVGECSCRESVAEVGKKHLLRVLEGSREANQESPK